MIVRGCCYPGCNNVAVITFALVPLCVSHYIMIEDETQWYYVEQTIKHDKRVHYHKINHLIPWRNKGNFRSTMGRKEKPLK